MKVWPFVAARAEGGGKPPHAAVAEDRRGERCGKGARDASGGDREDGAQSSFSGIAVDVSLLNKVASKPGWPGFAPSSQSSSAGHARGIWTATTAKSSCSPVRICCIGGESASNGDNWPKAPPTTPPPTTCTDTSGSSWQAVHCYRQHPLGRVPPHPHSPMRTRKLRSRAMVSRTRPSAAWVSR
jgi:hypothetical protein